jgi:histidyl-tRNA synthetase
MASPKQSKKIKPPKGTRDLYPEDLLRQRYITNAWRDASIRCGFEEIAGPTFESTDLYAVKSGDGILNELFQTFSGKGGSETLDKLVEKGKADFALRPEFTPTLARMYAAHAKQLPKPCKWFTAGPYFRAERPQRGRLREFLQWNCDILGSFDEGDTFASHQEVEALFPLLLVLENLGFDSETIRLKLGSRDAVSISMQRHKVDETMFDKALALLDARSKMSIENYIKESQTLGFPEGFIQEHHPDDRLVVRQNDTIDSVIKRNPNIDREGISKLIDQQAALRCIKGSLPNALYHSGLSKWTEFDSMIVRGLAYYTGTVFEAIADGERAVAGGGRYDNLIELFGGPPTPACGFGMGDVVLGNLLDDKALMPEGLELKEAVARPQASIRPQAFIVPNRESDNSETNEPLVHTLTANLRRGIESEQWLADENRKPWNTNRYAIAPLHARISYKSTTKLNKLRDDAIKQHAKFFVIIDDENTAQLHNLDTKESLGPFSPDPASQSYIGKAIAGATA